MALSTKLSKEWYDFFKLCFGGCTYKMRKSLIERPKCNRCKGSLDIWHDPETGIGLICNNPGTLQTDAQFTERFNSLPGDDVVKLEKLYGPIRKEN
jgi:hypothetical protein